MDRIHVCPACQALKRGVKSRIAFQHVDGCEFNREVRELNNQDGWATFSGKPSTMQLAILNKLAERAVKNL
jgi:hypothetical protein